MEDDSTIAANEDWLDTSDCPVCHKTARELRDADALDFAESADPWCNTCGPLLDDGACDPSDDECEHCGFPRFDCKCEGDWGDE